MRPSFLAWCLSSLACSWDKNHLTQQLKAEGVCLARDFRLHWMTMGKSRCKGPKAAGPGTSTVTSYLVSCIATVSCHTHRVTLYPLSGAEQNEKIHTLSPLLWFSIPCLEITDTHTDRLSHLSVIKIIIHRLVWIWFTWSGQPLKEVL